MRSFAARVSIPSVTFVYFPSIEKNFRRKYSYHTNDTAFHQSSILWSTFMTRVAYYLAFATLFLGSLSAQEDARLLRFPTIHDNQIVFTYSGDLYTVSSTGGVARKLTSHEGMEI